MIIHKGIADMRPSVKKAEESEVFDELGDVPTEASFADVDKMLATKKRVREERTAERRPSGAGMPTASIAAPPSGFSICTCEVTSASSAVALTDDCFPPMPEKPVFARSTKPLELFRTSLLR